MEPTKHDQDKPRWDLAPFAALDEVVRVLTYGAAKYSDDNWRGVVAQDPQRYIAACLRHLSAYQQGQPADPESGLSHLAHAACSLLFILENEKAPPPAKG